MADNNIIEEVLRQNRELLLEVEKLKKELEETRLMAMIGCPIVSEEERKKATDEFQKKIEQKEIHEKNVAVFL